MPSGQNKVKRFFEKDESLFSRSTQKNPQPGTVLAYNFALGVIYMPSTPSPAHGRSSLG
jgi:hypothetical protein